MKFATLKSIATKSATVALLAGAFALASPAKANAAVFVRVGPAPAPYYAYGYYGRPAYYGRPGYYAPRAGWAYGRDHYRYDHRHW